MSLQINRRAFMIGGLSCFGLYLSSSARGQQANTEYKTYPYGAKFGSSSSNGSSDTEVTRPVQQDDDWAKEDLISGGGPEVAMREAVRFGAYAKQIRDWRVAESLLKMRDQINVLNPKRSKADDGFIGDAIHAQHTSDHNPWVIDGKLGVVTAYDITHNPKFGCDGTNIAMSLADSKDPRIKYIIWNEKIANSESVNGKPPWTWRHYGGRDKHQGHVHLSVLPTKDLYDGVAEWKVKA